MNGQSFTLGDLRDPALIRELVGREFPDQIGVPSQLCDRFRKLAIAHPGHHSRPAMLLNVPGRIEVLGKHTDYAGGVSLTCASQMSMTSVVTAHALPSLIVFDEARGTQVEFQYAHPEMVTDQPWTSYVATVLRRFIRHFGAPDLGVSVVLSSNLPSASGMSSSSGLIVTISLALLGMGNILALPKHFSRMSRERFSGFAGAIESGADFEGLLGDEGVGTKGGSEDHAAIVCSTPNSLNLYSYFPVSQLGTVRFPDSVSFVVASSGVKARKTGEAKEAYNLASWRAKQVVSLWNEKEELSLQTMGDMVEHESFSRDQLRDLLLSILGGGDLWNRFAQFERECSVIIPGAMDALQNGQWASFGSYVDESQKMADQWLGNQVPETNDLVSMARNLGAHGASAFGAGFGGAVWALVDTERADQFLTEWTNEYESRYPSRRTSARFFRDQPSAGVTMQGSKYFSF